MRHIELCLPQRHALASDSCAKQIPFDSHESYGNRSNKGSIGGESNRLHSKGTEHNVPVHALNTFRSRDQAARQTYYGLTVIVIAVQCGTTKTLIPSPCSK